METTIVKTERGYDLKSSPGDDLLGWAQVHWAKAEEKAKADIPLGVAMTVTVYGSDGEYVGASVIQGRHKRFAAITALKHHLALQ